VNLKLRASHQRLSFEISESTAAIIHHAPTAWVAWSARDRSHRHLRAIRRTVHVEVTETPAAIVSHEDSGNAYMVGDILHGTCREAGVAAGRSALAKPDNHPIIRRVADDCEAVP